MTRKTEIFVHNQVYDASDAVSYHTGRFPPRDLDLSRIIEPQTNAAIALTRYDTLLQTLPNSELLLAPLRARDAVVSSRMEGTISTLEEVLRLEADADDAQTPEDRRDETVEVALYARALRQAERQMSDGYPISAHLVRTAHRTLLGYGRGADKRPGDFKTEQNYVGDRRQRRIDFIPISPDHLGPGIDALIDFIRHGGGLPLMRTAIAHAEFEALHPFDDGNGRLGRMLITLMLWDTGVLSAPHFFVSDYFERNKDLYVDRLRAVSAEDDWTGWCAFFLTALTAQAEANIDVVGRIRAHYDEMQIRFRDVLGSKWSTDALTYIFAHPIFRNSRFKRNAGIPAGTANGFTNRLVEAGILSVLIPPAGRAPGLYAFPSLLDIVRD
ncbi:MAG: Fic/DOC family N-terminal domain-containing protein [Pseudomonadota bacterium]